MKQSPAVAALVVIGLSLLGIHCRNVAQERPSRQMGELRSGIVERLGSAEDHEYLLNLQSNETLALVVEQLGVDAVVEVVNPVGRVELTVDSPNGKYGFEQVIFIAADRGSYRLRIHTPVESTSGHYSIKSIERRPATQQDRACIEAYRHSAEAEQLRKESGGTSERLLAAYKHALELRRQAGQPYLLALTLEQTGRMHHDLGDLWAAIECYEEARTLLQEAGDQHKEATVLNRVGLVYRLAGDPERAMLSFEEALAISQKVQDAVGEGVALNNLALWEVSVGEIHRAIVLYKQSQALWHSLGRQELEATAFHNLGSAYSRLGRFAEALDALNRALVIRQEMGRLDKLAGTLVAIGWVEHLSSEHQAAVERFLYAIDLFHQAGSRLGVAAAHDRLGTAYRRLGRNSEAVSSYRTSLEIYRTAGDKAGTAHTVTNLGCLLGDLGKSLQARVALDEACRLFESLGDRAGLAHACYCMGQVEHEDGQLWAARRSLERALGLVDELRFSAWRQGHPHPALSLWQDYSELYVELLMAQHELHPEKSHDERAFEVSDLARARRLYQMLLESQVDIASGVPQDFLESERAIQRQLNVAELRRLSLLKQGAPTNDIADVQITLRELLLELQSIRAKIRMALPRFAELRQPTPIGVGEVRQLLEPGTMLLSYVFGEERSFLFVVTRDRFDSFVLAHRQRLESLAGRCYHGLRNSDQRRAHRQAIENSLRLSKELIGPIMGELGNKRLLVIGDGMMYYIPFAALPLPLTTSGESRELLIDRFEVVHLPSVAVMKALRHRAAERSTPPKTLAVLADPVCSVLDNRLPVTARAAAPPSDNDWRPTFGSLPYTRLEAKSILDMVPQHESLAALAFTASPELVKSGELSRYRIVHFATHGLVNEIHPELSGIVLSMFDENGHPRDGHLRLHEIYALQLPADLVVLSACRTALGQRVQGEGLVGLTHGFFYAGASRLLVSLWDVHDQATAELMASFYRGLFEEQLSPPAALRAAQQRIRLHQRWQAEYYWAGFILEGDWR
jgi:CHAT domain-containing protein/Tfp pilus assembly protein PilF